MERHFLNNLVCPSCLTGLKLNETKDGLICTKEQLIYPIKDHIPVLLDSAALSLNKESL